MNDKRISKNTILIIIVLLFGLIVVGGTFAWLTTTVNTTNGTYSAVSDCFLIDYTDNTQTISGTLFPSSGPEKGLTGSVTLKVKSTCGVFGKGTLYLHVNNGTNTKFGMTVDDHCENPNTLVTLPDYQTSSDCASHGGTWVSGGTALKFALYDNNDFSSLPLAVGRFNNSIIGIDVPQYSNFDITYLPQTYYVYVWLDGYVSDNTYTDLTFDGYFYANASQQDVNVIYTSNIVNFDDVENTAIILNQPLSSNIDTYQTFEAADMDSGISDVHIKSKLLNNTVVGSYLDFVFDDQIYSFKGGINELSLTQKPVYESNKAIISGVLNGYESEICAEDTDGYSCTSNNTTLTINKDGGVMLDAGLIVCGIIPGYYVGIPGNDVFAGCMYTD